MSADDLHPDIHRRPITIRCSTCGSPYDEGHGVEDCLRTKDAEIERLREVVRKLHRLMPGPRGREVLFSPPEADAVRRALGDDAT